VFFSKLYPAKIDFHSIHKSIFALAAFGIGVLIALVPVAWSLIVFVGAIVLLAILYEPLVGLGMAILLGLLKAFVSVELPQFAAFYPGQIFFFIALGSWALRGLARRKFSFPHVPTNRALLAFAFIATLSLWSAADLENGLKEVIKWFEMAITAVLVVDAIRRRNVGWVIAMVLFAGSVQAAVGVWQFGLRGSGPDHFEIQPGFYRAYGSFEQPNPFGGFMGLVWPIAAGIVIALILNFRSETGKWRQKSPFSNLWFSIIFICLLFSAGLTLLALVLSFSRGAWLGAAAAGWVLLVFWPRRRLTGLALGIAAILVFLLALRSGALPDSVSARLAAVDEFVQVYDVRGAYFEEENFSLIERIAHWQVAISMASANPWLGVGIGNWDAGYSEFQLINWPASLGHAHNIYLNMLAEIGFLGLTVYLFLWISVAINSWRAAAATTGWPRGLAIGLLGVWTHLAVHQLVDNLFVNNLHFYIGTLFGLLAWLLKLRIPTQSEETEFLRNEQIASISA